MKHHLMIGLGVALALALAGPSLVGQSGQPAAARRGRSTRCTSVSSARRRPPAASPTWRCTRPIRRSSTSAPRTAASGRRRTTARRSRPQFQNQGLMSIGDVAVSQSNPDLVWVGTGESNNRQSTSWGDGVYKSHRRRQDLREHGPPHVQAHQPHRSSTRATTTSCFVAATGSLWGPGGERGVYKTDRRRQDLEAGAEGRRRHRAPTTSRWTRRTTGSLYASTYQRRRTACCMNGGGPGSGIWKSTDGGETWTRLKGRHSRRARSAASRSTSTADAAEHPLRARSRARRRPADARRRRRRRQARARPAAPKQGRRAGGPGGRRRAGAAARSTRSRRASTGRTTRARPGAR